MGDNRNILAGSGAAGADGTGLMWVAPTGSTAPTDATSALAAAWKNVGMITDNGLTIKVNTASKDVKAYGSLQIQRKIITDSSLTFSIEMLETNARTTELYWGLALNSISPGVGTGAFSYTFGTYTRQLFAAVFDVIDGTNRLRYYSPSVEVSDRGDIKVGNATEIFYPITLTAYPNTSGVTMQAYDVVPALG